jgi:hypothetical protein
LAEAVFKAFDLDNSGEVDEREFRDLLTIIYPGMPRSLVQSTIALVRPYYDHNGNLQVLLPPTALVRPLLWPQRRSAGDAPACGYLLIAINSVGLIRLISIDDH